MEIVHWLGDLSLFYHLSIQCTLIIRTVQPYIFSFGTQLLIKEMKRMKNPLKKSKVQGLRGWIQLGFFVLVAIIATANGLKEMGVVLPSFIGSASLHAICPFGGVVTFWNLVTDGILIKKIHDSSVVLASLGVLSALLFGPVLCGWICPFGTVQEWVGKLGRKLWKKRYNTFVPKKLDAYLRFLRYGVLIWVVYMTAVSGTLIFQTVDPYYALFNFWHSDVSVIGLIILAVVLVLSLFVERPFCKYACPYGAFLGVFNTFRIFAIRRKVNTCISCNACTKACPMNIDVANKETVKDHQCISCMKCSSESACPVAETVILNSEKLKKEVKTKYLGIISVLIILGGIGISSLLGLWNVESSKQPALIKEGAFAGNPSPTDIRGSYTWLDVAKAFSIPQELLVEAFDAVRAEDKVNLLETLYAGKIPEGMEVGTDSVRQFVSLYTGLPHEAEETTLLPYAAIEVLRREMKDTGSDFEEIAAKAVKLENLSPNFIEQTLSSVPIAFTGKTTFQELLDAGYAREDIERITGTFDSLSSAVKTFVEAKGMSFTEVKAKLIELLE